MKRSAEQSFEPVLLPLHSEERENASTLVNVTHEYEPAKRSYLQQAFPSYARHRPYHHGHHHHQHERERHDSPPMPQHKQSAVPPMNWGLVSRLDLQPRVRDDDQPSTQNRHEKHMHKLLRAQKNSVSVDDPTTTHLAPMVRLVLPCT